MISEIQGILGTPQFIVCYWETKSAYFITSEFKVKDLTKEEKLRALSKIRKAINDEYRKIKDQEL